LTVSAWLVTAVASGKLATSATVSATSAEDNWSSGFVAVWDALVLPKMPAVEAAWLVDGRDRK